MLRLRISTYLLLVRLIGSLMADGSFAASPELVLQAERQRIESVERVLPSAVCMYDLTRRGGGSGVLISADGYGLTNYHVVAGMLDTRTGYGGLGDGVLYDLEVLGIDPTGDVAMFRLKGPGVLPHSSLGDSDALQLGETVFAMGNPFIMSEDYSPTVTMGIVTGTHRYQWGVSGNLTYSDCIQTDASINPGNSGGPLFNTAGEVVGINGRISINARGRYNVGFGYAISSNQIRRFVPALRAGLIARHGTLFATVEEDTDGYIRFDKIAPESPLVSSDVTVGDRLIAFDGVELRSPNHLVSVLGAYPTDWPVPLTIEREGKQETRIVRLARIDPKMKHDFEVDPEVNVRQVRRILRHYREKTWPNAKAGEKRWTWSVNRTIKGSSEAIAFRVSETPDGIRQTRLYDDGTTGFVIAYNAESATRTDPSLEPAPLPDTDAAVYAALYFLQGAMLDSWEETAPPAVLTGMDAPANRTDVVWTQHSDPWEVVDWPISPTFVARYSFDPVTGYCMRIRCKDIPTNQITLIDLMEHKNVNGRVFPTKIRVRGPGLEYTDELSRWEPAS